MVRAHGRRAPGGGRERKICSAGFTTQSLQFWPGLLCTSSGFFILTAISSSRRRLVILISGRGSNMQALVRACRQENWPAEISAVIASRPDAAGLQWAKESGIPTACVHHRDYSGREAFDAALADEIDRYEPDYVILAGFMRVLTAGFVNRYAGRLVNIHPSLLPAFPGLHTHAQALATGVQIHGCTVHFVTPLLDHGPIIAQACVPVLHDDTPDTLALRVLEMEHRVFPAAVRWLAEGRVRLTPDHRVEVQGNPPRLYAGAAGEPAPH
ncbi:phosphoribosylglycinamide formyltransferase [Bordetella genomosp. 9]|uniref:Phosphoribosylglycinamide formyltransferase n=1 Tax=Bordetella genomosp. 9 TaxID=1416803 RepID=A0A1W6Z5Z4_9BORD|nr:phosphoribosylglycinamide formyltransferase [Bordetella genomosp. 9]